MKTTILLSLIVAGLTLPARAKSISPGYGPKPFIGGVRFRYYLPKAGSVAIAGDFNNWSPYYLTPLKKNGAFEGILPAIVLQKKERYRYKLIIDGIWQPDPSNHRTEYDLSGNLLSWFTIPDKIIVYSRVNPEKIGINSYRFIYRNPEAKSVRLVGSFNAFDPYRDRMIKDKNGVWSIEVQILPGPHQYCFIVDGRWIIDMTRVPIVENRFGRRFSSFTAR